MPVQPGSAFGPYQIVAPIGAGGMGEVYRAHDPRLNRNVALKFLRPEFSGDADRSQRFVREAQTLAALNHPHIAQLYGVEEDQGVRALVMEFVDGEDLAARLRRGALPIDDALDVARQIAAGLEAAHEQGIVHRDLKPANVKIRPDGSVKVLDLGLAKALTHPNSSSPQASLANSPTITSPVMTAANVILGTAAYMSPEQARGKAVDKRADVWAFGVVLYEMLTGRAAFQGETTTDLLAAVVSREPEWQALPQTLPRSVRNLLQRCLEKDVRVRLRDIGEARIALERPPVDEPASTESGRSAKPGFMGLVPWAVALVAIAAGAWVWTSRPTPVSPLRKIEISLPTPSSGYTVALSPDSKRIAYRSGDRISVRDLVRLTSTDLVASRATQRSVVFWSPDSAFIAYNDADAKLWIVPADGGAPRELCTIPDTGQLIGATWHTDNAITFAAWRGSVYRLSSSGGSPSIVLKVDPAKEVDFHYPVVLHDGRLVVATHVTAIRGAARPDRFVTEVIDGDRRSPALGDDILPVAQTAGHLLVERVDANVGLWAVPYSGTFPLKIEDGFLIAPGADLLSAAHDGSLLYALRSNTPHQHELVWVDRQGRTVGQVGSALLDLLGPSLSPDQQRVAFVARLGDSRLEVWVRDLRTNEDRRVTFDTVDQMAPRWFPDGRRLVYRENVRINEERVVAKAADGASDPVELLTGINPEISPDGRYLAYQVADQGAPKLRIAPIPPDGQPGAGSIWLKRTPEPVVITNRFSPDRKFLAYVEQQPGGSTEVFVSRFPDGGERWQVGAGRSPQWVSNTEIAYVTGSVGVNSAMMSVTLNAGDKVSLNAPKKLFDFGADFDDSGLAGQLFDVSSDGRKFLMIRERANSRAAIERRWVLVQNWLAEFAGTASR